MGEETSWFDFLPGVHNLTLFAKGYLGRTSGLDRFQTEFTLTHVLSVAMILLLLTIGAIVFFSAVKSGDRDAIVPPRKFTLRNLYELFTEGVLKTSETVMGEENARRFLPLMGTLAFFIFFSNILTLIPGFIPPTATLKTNVALALTVFVLTHYYGVRANGLAYFKHFLGPVWWLAWLMLPIELVSHFARPLSLSLRLLGNMAADHKVVATFLALVPLLVPIPFLFLGVLVCVVQTLVFCLLAMVYIQGAVSHEHEEDHHDPDPKHAMVNSF